MQKTFFDTRPEGPIVVQFYDATHPEARKFVWEQIREGYYKHGIKVWWLDACEPEVDPQTLTICACIGQRAGGR